MVRVRVGGKEKGQSQVKEGRRDGGGMGVWLEKRDGVEQQNTSKIKNQADRFPEIRSPIRTNQSHLQQNPI
jgi:hypothetical protein